MSEIIEFITSHNAQYVEAEGLHQRLFRSLFHETPEHFLVNEPGFLLQNAPTIDISHFWSYLIERLKICPIEQPVGFSALLTRALQLPKNRIPAFSFSLGSLYDCIHQDDPAIAKTALSSGLNHLKDKDLLTLLTSGAPAYKQGAGRINKTSLPSHYCEALEQYVAENRPALLKKAPANTCMAIYKRLGWSAALERAGGKSRDGVFAEDLGL